MVAPREGARRVEESGMGEEERKGGGGEDDAAVAAARAEKQAQEL